MKIVVSSNFSLTYPPCSSISELLQQIYPQQQLDGSWIGTADALNLSNQLGVRKMDTNPDDYPMSELARALYEMSQRVGETFKIDKLKATCAELIDYDNVVQSAVLAIYNMITKKLTFPTQTKVSKEMTKVFDIPDKFWCWDPTARDWRNTSPERYEELKSIPGTFLFWLEHVTIAYDALVRARMLSEFVNLMTRGTSPVVALAAFLDYCNRMRRFPQALTAGIWLRLLPDVFPLTLNVSQPILDRVKSLRDVLGIQGTVQNFGPRPIVDLNKAMLHPNLTTGHGKAIADVGPLSYVVTVDDNGLLTTDRSTPISTTARRRFTETSQFVLNDFQRRALIANALNKVPELYELTASAFPHMFERNDSAQKSNGMLNIRTSLGLEIGSLSGKEIIDSVWEGLHIDSGVVSPVWLIDEPAAEPCSGALYFTQNPELLERRPMITCASEPVIIKYHPIFKDWKTSTVKSDIMTGLTVAANGTHPRAIIEAIDPFLFKHALINSSSFDIIMAIATTSGYMLWPNSLVRSIIAAGGGDEKVDASCNMTSSVLHVDADTYKMCREIIKANGLSGRAFFDPGFGVLAKIIQAKKLNDSGDEDVDYNSSDNLQFGEFSGAKDNDKDASVGLDSWPGPMGLSISDWNTLAPLDETGSFGKTQTHCLFTQHTIGYGISFWVPNVLPIFVDRAEPWSTSNTVNRDPRVISKHQILSEVCIETINWRRGMKSFQFPLPYRALDDGEIGSLRNVAEQLGIISAITLSPSTDVILIPVPESLMCLSTRRRLVHYSRPLVSLTVNRPVEVDEMFIDTLRWGCDYSISIPASVVLWDVISNNVRAVTASGRKPIPSQIDAFSVNEDIFVGPGISGFKHIATTTSIKTTTNDSSDYELDINLDDSYEPIVANAGPIYNVYALSGSLGLILKKDNVESFSTKSSVKAPAVEKKIDVLPKPNSVAKDDKEKEVAKTMEFKAKEDPKDDGKDVEEEKDAKI